MRVYGVRIRIRNRGNPHLIRHTVTRGTTRFLGPLLVSGFCWSGPANRWSRRAVRRGPVVDWWTRPIMGLRLSQHRNQPNHPHPHPHPDPDHPYHMTRANCQMTPPCPSHYSSFSHLFSSPFSLLYFLPPLLPLLLFLSFPVSLVDLSLAI